MAQQYVGGGWGVVDRSPSESSIKLDVRLLQKGLSWLYVRAECEGLFVVSLSYSLT